MKILCVGEAPTINSGFANVFRELNAHWLEEGHEIRQLGWCHGKERENPYPYKIYPVQSPFGYENYYGVNVFDGIIDEYNPDVVFSLADVYMVNWMPNMRTRKKFKWILYTPIDSTPIPRVWRPTLENADLVITYSKFAHEALLSYQANFKSEPQMIYHGYNPEQFYKMDEEEIKLVRFNNRLENKFVYTFVGTNSTRKHPERLLLAWNQFCKGKDDVVLLMHTKPSDERQGFHLKEILYEYDMLGEEVVFVDGANPINGVPIEHMNKLYNMSDVMVSAASCFVPGTLVYINKHVMPIEDVEEGLFARTHLNNKKPVVQVFKREVKSEVLYKIDPVKLRGLSVEVTGEHPVLALKARKCEKNSLNITCKPNCNVNLRNGCSGKIPYGDPEWIKVKNLNVGDIIVHPIDSQIIDNPDISTDLAKLSGYFIAEGHVCKQNGRSINFTFGTHELEYIDEVNSLLSRMFPNRPIFNRPQTRCKTATTITIHHAEAARLFRYLFYDDYGNKVIPEVFMKLPKYKQIELLHGIINGDGCVTKNKFSIKTASEPLAMQLFYLGLRLGFVFQIGKDMNKYDGAFNQKPIFGLAIQGPQCLLSIFDSIRNIETFRSSYKEKGFNFHHSHYWMDEKYAYFPITRIETRIYDGYVYNFEVKDDNSYVAGNLTVHNCEGFGLPLLEAAACGTPSIGVNYSSIPELIKGHGELVKPITYYQHKPLCQNRPLIDIDDFCDKMEKLYHNEELLKNYETKCINFAKKFTWDKIFPKFDKALSFIEGVENSDINTSKEVIDYLEV